MSEEIDRHRRRFFGTAAMTLAAAQLGMVGAADAQPGKTKPIQMPAIKRGTNTSFASLKQVNAGVLNVGYAEAGPADGPAVLLLHGWPYDIHSYVDVAPLLASAGYRVIVPYLRGYGTTRFLSDATPRNGQQSALAVDAIALMDACGVARPASSSAIYLWNSRPRVRAASPAAPSCGRLFPSHRPPLQKFEVRRHRCQRRQPARSQCRRVGDAHGYGAPREFNPHRAFRQGPRAACVADVGRHCHRPGGNHIAAGDGQSCGCCGW